ncbi:phage Mu protein F like protein [Longilinea arvoryzae]|uniref:Phage Mu protein F like protein n=1 Tax=Longilinea arvoryzae TaxID=360412 RepID=A0A0S7BB71_9CHLR|nr:phage minor head protein [Longilinea arvoryzae]GAP14887.1 phage Mu protein F like protein [Longilinea arvoryzae]
MPTIYEQGRAFQRELLQHERAAASEMVRYYGNIWRSLNDQIQTLVQSYYADPEHPANWLYRYDRLNTLRAQTEAQIREFAAYANTSIRSQQLYAVEQAQSHAEQLVRLGLGTPPEGVTLDFNRLPTEALSDLIGFLSDGSPLSSSLAELAGSAGQAVADGLVTGLALGWNPRRIAASIRQALGGDLVRALRLARTETLRAYRESTRRNYQANSNVLHGWIWMSARNERTCGMCWAMHGTKHGLDEMLDDHPNGRCTMLPWTKTWAELGYDGVPDNPELEPGSKLFEKLNPEKQRAILGPAKYAAWRDGRFTLSQIVGRRNDPRWGSMRFERNLKDLIGEDATNYTRLALMQTLKSAGNSVDDLVRIGYLGLRDLSPEEIRRIQEEVARMPFATRTVKVPLVDRGKIIDGVQLERYTRSDIYHLYKHIKDRQWQAGATSEMYFGDLRQAIRNAERISTYRHQNEQVVGFLSNNSIDASHLGLKPENFVYVVYSINQHAIITGYQTSGLSMLTIPEGAVWLK